MVQEWGVPSVIITKYRKTPHPALCHADVGEGSRGAKSHLTEEILAQAGQTFPESLFTDSNSSYLHSSSWK
ncbi:hypothetical protein Plim_1031 [Planctopirus limnophila DSM 3776]|uniref:Uncharacterized protein n=1 Tax=Planctopirus limnophila (strain ATCC 43296 / DSM 3776 / IFAM 1008 / Mu 290) TaxID=521674 RepID=D5STA6_PLAL2|nr:hypothetical protein Plim_1031 [Planctopirus limnophila DSM 3776]